MRWRAGQSILFAATLFLSAGLLFCMQPMIAKRVLPLLGGSPAVWNVCMVFFQAELLAGYAYAHATSTRRGRYSAPLHAVLLLVPCLVLPGALLADASASLPFARNPIPWLIGTLLVTAGLPFFVVSSTAPLLQRWFASTGHPHADDPYYLYGASNLGSLVALVGYPLLVEPNLPLPSQTRWWSVGYVLLVGLTWLCALSAWRRSGNAPGPTPASSAAGATAVGDRRAWLTWVGLAFVPSSLLLGVTTYIATDLASIPLLWVIPLGLYLITFILAFARRPVVRYSVLTRVLPILLVLVAVSMGLGSVQAVLIPLHLAAFFLAALACHTALADRRPAPRDLTRFYLAISVGGALGGAFNALAAPLLFDRLAEYPIAIVLACLALSRAERRSPGLRQRLLDALEPAALCVLAAGVLTALKRRPEATDAGLARVVLGVAGLVCYSWSERPLRFALGMAAILAAGAVGTVGGDRVLHQERSFFGVVRVVHDTATNSHRLIHGYTLHGQQRLDPAGRREPLNYYHRSGPVAPIIAAWADGRAPRRIGVVGLGAGSLAAYAEPGQEWTFYEIDPAVVRIARDPRCFTFLADCRAGAPRVVLGDGRVRLREAPSHTFGLLILDAFSSDSIPLHLLTREALRIYREKLDERGILAIHISNRFVALEPVLAALARDARLELRVRADLTVCPSDERAGKQASTWAAMAVTNEALGPLADDPVWRSPRPEAGAAVWTDDHSDLVHQLYLFRRTAAVPDAPRAESR